MSAVAFNDVTITLGSRRILAGVSFAIEAGEFVGVMGPNGAGKTTMMRAVLGLLPPSSGHIDVLGAAPRRGNAQIGYVPQSRRAAARLNFTATDLLLSSRAGNRWGLPVSSAQARS